MYVNVLISGIVWGNNFCTYCHLYLYYIYILMYFDHIQMIINKHSLNYFPWYFSKAAQKNKKRREAARKKKEEEEAAGGIHSAPSNHETNTANEYRVGTLYSCHWQLPISLSFSLSISLSLYLSLSLSLYLSLSKCVNT